MRVHRTVEEEWESYSREVLEGKGIDPAAMPGLRQIFFCGAGAMLALAQHTPLMRLRDEIVAFHTNLPGRPN